MDCIFEIFLTKIFISRGHFAYRFDSEPAFTLCFILKWHSSATTPWISTHLLIISINSFMHLLLSSGIWQSEVKAFCQTARVCWRHFKPANIVFNVKGDQVIVKRKNGVDPDVTDEDFICNNARHDLGDGIPGSAVEVPLALNRLGMLTAMKLSDSGKHPFTAAHVETSAQSYLAKKQREQAQLQTDAAKQQKESAKQTSMFKRQLEASKRKLDRATDQFPPGQDALELVHDGFIYRKKLEDEATRRASLVDQFVQKCTKKGFSGEAFALLCADGAPFTYARMIRCPDSIVRYMTSFESAAAFQAFWECTNKGTTLNWWRDLQSHCGTDTLPIKPEDAFLLMLCVAVAGMDEQLVSMLFGLTMFRVSRVFEQWINWFAAYLLKITPEAGNSRFVELSMRMGPHVTDPGLTHIIDTSATEIHRPASQSAQSATFSDYYGCNCGKWLVAISPSGFIRYISRAFPGRILDTKICSCGFYQHLEALKAEGVPSAVQADKGFYCYFEMAAHNATLVVPSPASAQNQMSETQVEHTARIANERIFVEHAVKAVKRFKWLQRRVPLIQVDLIDPVLTVAALMANFTHRPFVKKEVRALYPTDPCAYQLVYDRNLPFKSLD